MQGGKVVIVAWLALTPGAATALEQNGAAAAEPSGEVAAQAPADADAIGAVVKSAGGKAPAAASEPQLVAEDGQDPAYLIGKELRCPVCQGMPIADSPADMAQDMMKKVRALHAEGKSREEILEHFTRSYGEWVLLRPPTRGFSWLVWVIPPAALLIGLWLVRRTFSPQQQPSPAPEVPGEPTEEDEYRRRVRQEVEA